MVNSKSSAMLLFNNRHGKDEKGSEMYQHKFFEEDLEPQNKRVTVTLKKHGTKRLNTPLGCVLTKRNSLAMVPKNAYCKKARKEIERAYTSFQHENQDPNAAAKASLNRDMSEVKSIPKLNTNESHEKVRRTQPRIDIETVKKQQQLTRSSVDFNRRESPSSN